MASSEYRKPVRQIKDMATFPQYRKNKKEKIPKYLGGGVGGGKKRLLKLWHLAVKIIKYA